MRRVATLEFSRRYGREKKSPIPKFTFRLGDDFQFRFIEVWRPSEKSQTHAEGNIPRYGDRFSALGPFPHGFSSILSDNCLGNSQLFSPAETDELADVIGQACP